MTVYKRIAVIKVEDTNNPTKEIEIFQHQNQFKGIDVIPLGVAGGLHQATIKLVCSDNNPQQPKTDEDIERLLSRLNVIKTLDKHPADPESKRLVNHALQITQNLDDPNIADHFLKKGHAKRVHDEVIPKDIIRGINERYEAEGKKKLDEDKDTYSVGEVERG